MPFTGKRMTEPPPGIGDAIPPIKRRKGRVLTGQYNTTPPEDVAATSTIHGMSADKDTSSAERARVWHWEEHTSSRQTEYKKRTVPLQLSDDSDEPDGLPRSLNPTTDTPYSTEYRVCEGAENHRPYDDPEGPIEPRSSRGKVSCCEIAYGQY